MKEEHRFYNNIWIRAGVVLLCSGLNQTSEAVHVQKRDYLGVHQESATELLAVDAMGP